jgi:hypothetical protein
MVTPTLQHLAHCYNYLKMSVSRGDSPQL